MITVLLLTSFGRCALCGNLIPQGHKVLQHPTGRIICVPCLVDIALVKLNEE